MNKTLPLFLLCLLLAACGGSVSSRLTPAVSDGPYAQVLVACAHVFKRGGNNSHTFCSLDRLPLLGQEHEQIGVQEIMARTVISHPWMAVRFEQVLEQLPAELLQLFQATTAVVIGADIRPSYYWSATGAIYLDPASLWRTAGERDTISRAPDFRSDFGRELNFASLARYVEGNDYAWPSYSLSSTAASRPLSHIVRPMAALLFHELAHANDFVPPAQLPQLDAYSHMPLWQAAQHLDLTISEVLDEESPLQSDLLFDLADVMYSGVTATDALKSVYAEEVGLAFEVDGASDDYAYSSLFEDTAMLFEEIMMKHHFGVDREVAYTDVPAGNDAFCEDYIVRWGVRNRIGEPLVRQRAELVLRELLNRPDVSEYFEELPEPTELITGMDWCTNLDQFGTTGIQAFGLRAHSAPRSLREDDLRPELRDHHLSGHHHIHHR